MRIVLSLVFILITNYVSTQVEKPVHYQDENKDFISKEVFLKKLRNRKDSINYFPINFVTDSSYIQRLVKRKNYGRLNELKLKELYQSISTDKTIPTEKYTIIQYHPGKDRCNDGQMRANRYEKHYLKKLKKTFNYKHFWIHKIDGTMNFNQRNIDWITDINKTVERFFFKYHYLCYSFVIINNETGLFISLYSEYGKQKVIEVAEEMKRISKH